MVDYSQKGQSMTDNNTHHRDKDPFRISILVLSSVFAETVMEPAQLIDPHEYHLSNTCNGTDTPLQHTWSRNQFDERQCCSDETTSN